MWHHDPQDSALSDDGMKVLYQPSSAEEWAATGKELFASRQYDSELMCFQRAGDAHGADWCQALLLLSEADQGSQNSCSGTQST